MADPTGDGDHGGGLSRELANFPLTTRRRAHPQGARPRDAEVRGMARRAGAQAPPPRAVADPGRTFEITEGSAASKKRDGVAPELLQVVIGQLPPLLLDLALQLLPVPLDPIPIHRRLLTAEHPPFRGGRSRVALVLKSSGEVDRAERGLSQMRRTGADSFTSGRNGSKRVAAHVLR